MVATTVDAIAVRAADGVAHVSERESDHDVLSAKRLAENRRGFPRRRGR